MIESALSARLLDCDRQPNWKLTDIDSTLTTCSSKKPDEAVTAGDTFEEISEEISATKKSADYAKIPGCKTYSERADSELFAAEDAAGDLQSSPSQICNLPRDGVLFLNAAWSSVREKILHKAPCRHWGSFPTDEFYAPAKIFLGQREA